MIQALTRAVERWTLAQQTPAYRTTGVLLGIAEHDRPVLELQRPHSPRCQHNRMASELLGPDLERRTSSQRAVQEEQRDRFALEGVAVGGFLETLGVVEQSLELGS